MIEANSLTPRSMGKNDEATASIVDTTALLLSAVLFEHFKNSLSLDKEKSVAAPVPAAANRVIAISRELGIDKCVNIISELY